MHWLITDLLRPLAAALALVTALAVIDARGQTAAEPQREELLNGLRVLIWNRPGDSSVVLKLRIHSGAVFDLSGKGGQMALLGDLLFPEQGTYDFFSEELAGHLSVRTDYDGITVTLAGKASEYERIADLLRNAVINTPLTNENIDKIKTAKIEELRKGAGSARLLADQLILSRYFGLFPYARPAQGTPESVALIDRADLQLAKERFLNPNNATLVVAGGVENRRVMRALRQFLGIWRKSDTIAPPTFRQPEAPDARVLIADYSGAERAELRVAVGSAAKALNNAAAMAILGELLRSRLKAAVPSAARESLKVHNELRTLPSALVISASVADADAASVLVAIRKVVAELSGAQPSAAEVELARNALVSAVLKRKESVDSVAELWIELDECGVSSVADRIQALNAVTPARLQSLAATVLREQNIATIAVGNARKLEAELGEVAKIQMQTAPKIEPAQPVKKPN